MLTETEAMTTRVWWNDAEVMFVAWTEKALVFRWYEGTTNGRGIIQLPRGATRRLISRGILRIDGDIPAWLYDSAPLPAAPTPRRRPAPAPAPVYYDPEPIPVVSAPPKTDLRNIVMRLIRKLTGENAPLKQA